MSEPEHLRITYNEVHNIIRESAKKVAEFKPDMLIAIGEKSILSFFASLYPPRGYSPGIRSVIDRLLCPTFRGFVGGGQVDDPYSFVRKLCF